MKSPHPGFGDIVIREQTRPSVALSPAAVGVYGQSRPRASSSGSTARAGLYLLAIFAIGRLHELVAFPRIGVVLVIGVATVMLALLLPPAQRNPLWRQREVQIVVALGAVAVLLSPLGVWPGGSWQYLRQNYLALPVFFALIVALAVSERALRNLILALLAGVGVLGIFTIQAVSTVSGRAYAGDSTYDPNDVAMIMVLTLPLAAFAAVGLRGIGRVAAGGVAVICVAATAMTVSRGGFIGLAFVGVLLLFRLGTATFASRLMILGALAALLVVAAPASYWDRMSTIWSPTGKGYDETGVYSRIELWTNGLKLFVDNAVTGVGIGNYEVAEGRSHGGRRKWSAAHNSFIQLGTELGIVGFALFLALLVTSIRNARHVFRAARARPELHDLAWIAAAVATSLYVYLALGFALSHAYSSMLYFLVGLATALRLQLSQRLTTASVPVADAPRERVRWGEKSAPGVRP